MENISATNTPPMNLVRSGIAIIILIFVSLPAFSQRSILWEITGNDLQSPSYLMGTLKFIGEKEFFVPAEAHAKMKECKFFAIEDEIDHHAQHELNKAVHFQGKESLKTVLTKEDYSKVQKLFESEFGINSSKFEKDYARLKPLAISIAMTRLSLGEKILFYDLELVKEAKKNGLETYSLEHIEREAEALSRYPMKDQVHALMHSVDNFGEQKEEFQLLMEDYPHGDLDKIFSYTLHPMENNPVFIEEFYYKRNEEWIPKIDKMVHDKPSFIAVGISHLKGDRGLLSLLKQKGYSLKAISITPKDDAGN